MKRAWIFLYCIWFAANIIVLAIAMTKGAKYDDDPFELDLDLFGSSVIDKSAFYPFQSSNIYKYDLSEFLIYAIAVPLLLFAIVKLVLIFIQRKNKVVS